VEKSVTEFIGVYDADVIAAAKDAFPCVLARRHDQLAVVLGPLDLELLDGSPEALMNRLLVLEEH